MTTLEERAVFAKLEALKEIRTKTLHLEKLKMRITREIETTDQEEKCLQEYKQEMDLLLQEKMSHVEELRQIHADINAMEGVIKNSEESRIRALNAATRFHEEYRPLKAEIDRLRRDCLGLDRLPELHEEEGSSITPDRFASAPNFYSVSSKLTGHQSYHLIGAKAPSVSMVSPTSADWSRSIIVPDGGGGGGTTGGGGSTTTTSFLSPPPPPSPLRLVASVAAGAKNEGNHRAVASSAAVAAAAIIGPTPAFRSDFVSLRQQPPPMKSCLSCHQQIHRNAPICPLCKAKSRSRNPKKPKKKDHA